MGIFSFFSKEKKLEKEIRRANNKHTPKDYRQIALHNVIEKARAGEEAAIVGLLSRFAVNAEPSIEDEKEKEWVCDALADIGRAVLPALRRSLRTAESVNWVQRTFRNIVEPQEYKTELLSVLEDFDTEYERNPDRKIQTIAAVAEVPGTDVAEALLRFLEDVDETVRFQTVASVVKLADEVAREPLLKVICEDESIRVRNAAVEAFAVLGWPTTGYKKKIEPLLPSGYKHDKSGKITKLGTS